MYLELSLSGLCVNPIEKEIGFPFVASGAYSLRGRGEGRVPFVGQGPILLGGGTFVIAKGLF